MSGPLLEGTDGTTTRGGGHVLVEMGRQKSGEVVARRDDVIVASTIS